MIETIYTMIVNQIEIILQHIGNLVCFIVSFIFIVINYGYSIHIFFALALLCIILWIIKSHKAWKKGWLSELIEEEIKVTTTKKDTKKIRRYATYDKDGILSLIKLNLIEAYDKLLFYRKRFCSDLKYGYLPSITTFVVLILFSLVLFYFSHRGVPYSSILSVSKWLSFFRRGCEDGNVISNLLTITVGLVSIVFAIVIFIAESIRDSKDIDQKKTLLKISGIWYLVTFTVLSLLNFLVFQITYFSLVFPIIIALLSIYSFGKIILNLIDQKVQKKDKVSFLKDRIRKNIYESIRERSGNNILLKKIGYDKEIKLEYTFSKTMVSESMKDYIFIESDAEGKIIDVNLDELKKMAIRLQSEARKLGLNNIYISEAETAITKDVSSREREKEGNKSLKKIYLLKRYGEYLPPTSIFTEDRKVIFAIPIEFVKNIYVEKYIDKMIPHMFKFSTNATSSELFRKEMQGVKDSIINSIRTLSLGTIEDSRQIYINLAEEFLKILHEFGGGYSAEQAREERGNIFEGWNEMRWLKEDIRELMAIASESNNQDIISGIMFLPAAISIRAFSARDHFLFQEFLSLHLYIYYLAKDIPDEKIKLLMIEDAWRYLKEISHFHIEAKIKDRNQTISKEDIIEYREFSLYVLKMFQSLIKASFDNKDIKSFEIFLSEFEGLYNGLKNEYPSSSHLENLLKYKTDEGDVEEAKLQIERIKEKEETIERIALAKKQIIFAIVSKIFDSYRKNPNDQILKNYFDFINAKIFGNTVEELTKVFDSCRNYNAEHYWEWDNWELIADGEVHSIDFYSKLDYFYIVKILELLGQMSDENISQIDMPYSENLAFLAEDRADSGTLIHKLKQVKENPQNWTFIIKQDSISKIDKLIELLQSARHKQEKAEQEILKNAKIDPDKLIEFKKEVHKTFLESGKIRPLIKKLNIYENKISEKIETDTPSYGYNQIDDKAAFIKDWHVHYGEWGEQYGAGMANSEDVIFFETLARELEDNITTSSKGLISAIEDNIKELNLKNPIIIQSLKYTINSIEESKIFIEKWRNDCPKTELSAFDGFIGVLKYDSGLIVPVFDLFVTEEKINNKVIIADIRHLGLWEQYSPIEKEEDDEYLDDIFYIRVGDLNIEEELREKILSENSSWLQKYDDKEGYLRQRVVIRIYEKFKFIIKDQKQGVVITVTELEDGNII